MSLPLDWWKTATANDVTRALGQIDAAQKRLAAEPRPDVAYVSDVPADGTVEISWWSSLDKEWKPWVRVSREDESPLGQAYRRLCFRDGYANIHRDEVVRVRPVMDMQTGQTLGQVA